MRDERNSAYYSSGSVQSDGTKIDDEGSKTFTKHVIINIKNLVIIYADTFLSDTSVYILQSSALSSVSCLIVSEQTLFLLEAGFFLIM